MMALTVVQQIAIALAPVVVVLVFRFAVGTARAISRRTENKIDDRVANLATEILDDVERSNKK